MSLVNDEAGQPTLAVEVRGASLTYQASDAPVGGGPPTGGVSRAGAAPAQVELVFTGTVRRVAVEGGFFGVVADDGRKFNPTKLSKEYRTDGLRVVVRGKARPDLRSFQMWGQIIQVTDIRKADSSP